MKSVKIRYNPLVIVLVLYFAALVIINPIGEFVVNDEWAHTMQVEGFLHRSFRIQANTDAVLILQAALGFAAALVFGYSLSLLKVLILLSSVTLLIGLYKICIVLKVPSSVILLVLLLTAFNPLILHLSGVFMTDIPFLTLFVWAIFFYLRNSASKNAVVGSLVSGLAVLIRQAGVVPFIAHIIINVRKVKSKTFLLSCLLFGTFFAGYLIYPRYSAESSSGGLPILTNLINLDDVPARIVALVSSLFYFGFFTFPLVVIVKKVPLAKYVHSGIAILIAIPVYLTDIFPIGNVLYLEGLYAKNYSETYISLFNNIVFKVVVALIIGFAIVGLGRFVCFAYGSFMKTSRDTPTLFLALIFAGSLGILLFGNDMYDRYLLPALIALLVLLASNTLDFEQLTRVAKVASISGVVFFVIVSVALVYDYTTATKLRWAAADEITAVTQVKTKIYLDGTFAKYKSSRKIKDYTGLTYIETSQHYECYTEVLISGLTDETNMLLNKKKRLIFRPDTEDQIIFDQSYFSPQYALLGVSTKVVGWCDLK